MIKTKFKNLFKTGSFFLKKTTSTLFRGTAIYLIANIISGIIPFALIIVTTRYLSPSDFGVTALFAALYITLTAVFSLGINGAVSRYYFEFTSTEFVRFLGSCFSLIGLCGLFLSVLTYVIGQIYLPTINFPVEHIWSVLIVVISQVTINIGLALFQVKNQFFYYLLIQVLQATIMAIGSILLIVIFSFGWRGYVFSQILSSLIVCILILRYLIITQAFDYCIDKKYWGEALRYGMPIAIHAIGGITIVLSARFILAEMTSLEALGIYSFASQIVTIFIFVIDAFNKAYTPWIFSTLSERSMDLYPKIIRFTYLYFILVLILSVIFALLAGWFIRIIFVIQYHAAIKLIFPLSLAAAFMGMYFMVTVYLQFSKRTKILAAISITTGIIQIILCIKFIEWWGMIGASYSLIIAQFLLLLGTWVAAAYFFPMPWKRSFIEVLGALRILLTLIQRYLRSRF